MLKILKFKRSNKLLLLPVIIFLLVSISIETEASNSTTRRNFPFYFGAGVNKRGISLMMNYNFSYFLSVGPSLIYRNDTSPELKRTESTTLMNFQLFPIKSSGWFVELSAGSSSDSKWEITYCSPTALTSCGTVKVKLKGLAYGLQTGFKLTNNVTRLTGGVGLGYYSFGTPTSSVKSNSTGTISDTQLIDIAEKIHETEINEMKGSLLISVFLGYSF